MYTYKVILGDGSKTTVRANSPKEAYEYVEKTLGYVVAHIKWVRGKVEYV